MLHHSFTEIQGLLYRQLLSLFVKLELFGIEQFSLFGSDVVRQYPIKSRIKSMLERRRQLPQPDLTPVPSGASPLPYGRRRDDAETAHIRKWVGLADAALELNQPNTGGLKGNQTFSRSNVTRVFEIFFGPKRRRSIGGRGDLLI